MGKHVDALTGVRGIAVLIVFLAHLQQRYFTYPAFVGTVVAYDAYFGITIFFVLSGFVIHWNYAKLFATETPIAACWKFFVARFSRLWPLHFAVSVFAIAWSQKGLLLFIQHIFMVQTWVYEGSFNISYFNTWSISTEWFFYFTYAAIYPLIARWLRWGSIWMLLGMFAAAFSIYWMAGQPLTVDDLWLRYIAPYLRVLEFFTGVVAAQIVMTRRAQNREVPGDIWALLALTFTVFLYQTTLGGRTGINYLIAPLVAITLIVASDRRSIASRGLSTRWLLWIGDRSYSIYLLEAVYLVFCDKIERPLGYTYEPTHIFSFSDVVTGMALSAVSMGIVFAIANLCWRYFEMPTRKVIKRALSGRSGSTNIVLIN